jgi:hypothetical protein
LADLKYGEALKFDPAPLLGGLVDSIGTDRLKPIAGSFVRNIDNIINLLFSPVFLVFWARNFARCEVEAMLKLTGRPTFSDAISTETLKRLSEQHHELMASWYHASSTNFMPDHEIQRSIDCIDILLGEGRERLNAGFEAMLFSAIIGCWTAFETMAGDMWEEAINENPATMLLSLAKIETKHGQEVQKVQLSLGVEEFKRAGYSLQGKIGTLLRHDPRYAIQLDKYDRISEAYKRAFNCSFSSLDSNVDRSLFALAQIRNAIVHNAGLADKPFLDKMVEIASPLPQFVGLQLGDRVPIDGELVKTLVVGSIDASVKLIADVDSWLAQQ